MRKREKFSLVLGWFLVAMIAVGVVVLGLRLGREEEIQEAVRELPRLEIELAGTTLSEMKAGDKETKYFGNQVKIFEGDSEEDYDDVEIKGRGNATWRREKKPWQLEFSERTELLGITKAKRWVLLANVADPSHLRNFIALELEEMLGRKYNYAGRMVEVSFNGEYEGLFYLVPKVELEPGSVDLRGKMGVLVELDNVYNDGEYSESLGGSRLRLKKAVSEKDVEARENAMKEFMADYNRLEKAAEEGDFKTVSEVADLTSFAEYYLVNEFALDPDAYFIGFYYYKDGSLDKIHAGPGWDFDMGFGNASWGGGVQEEYYSTEAFLVRRNYEPMNELMFNLMNMEEFRELVGEVFRERLSGRGGELVALARKEAGAIREAVRRDAEKWGYDNYEGLVKIMLNEERAEAGFEAETDYVLDFIERRFEFFEKTFGGEKEGEGREFL